MIDLIYPALTTLFICEALISCLTVPIMGGMNGLTVLIILLIKFIIGNKRKKLEQKIEDTVEKITPNKNAGKQAADEVTKQAKQKISQKISQKAAKQAVSSAAKSNWVTLLIDYLTTPMNRFEKGMLLLGWVLWPIFFPLTIVVIVMAIKDTCVYVGIDWCPILTTVFNL